jgi:hypothetical protein
MCEIRFRVWNEEKKRMLYSTESYDYGNTEFQFIDGELSIVRYRCGWNNFPIAEKVEGVERLLNEVEWFRKENEELQKLVDKFSKANRRLRIALTNQE